ncbi:CehA/McbA family metallohydrolase [Paenibacillus radicis (ex Xue et al. 2023)]|uniref:CehA/McbA family metallohydrolase n=1 Tax=Paenibacillus radicis (ex Xue et al. 2023) TaxID=2972489 RepID=A0ABT1YSU2_9BACL|nr:CehA/McbA family metallohydrolase [Paenibacillus radicis (ex Xue et al. 2023)]MCR8636250.1 CehA/McbA family metallohydrolase [Paenibacillus radicis (ex Xue et al. 2023)]
MKQWLPYELHTHTFHSDGEHSLLELARSAKELGLFGIAMTDHNTMSPLLEREQIQSETQLQIIRGMEWTTFFGHMLAIGITDYVDWRDLGIKDIHKGIERVHKQGGIVGIAHPYRVGSPLCTGCYWEYEIADWDDIDYIEVWSYTFPSIMNSNQRAFQLWTDRLNQGHRIAAVCGRDWHVSSIKITEPIAVTYLGLENNRDSALDPTEVEKLAVDAIKEGAVSVTMGPRLQCALLIEPSGSVYGIGSVVKVTEDASTAVARVEVDFSERAEHWRLDDQELKVRLVSNKGTVGELKVSRQVSTASYGVDLAGLIWLRAELHGAFHNSITMIAFTNPFYFQHDN